METLKSSASARRAGAEALAALEQLRLDRMVGRLSTLDLRREPHAGALGGRHEVLDDRKRNARVKAEQREPERPGDVESDITLLESMF